MAGTPRSQVIAFGLGIKEATFGAASPDMDLTTWIACNTCEFPERDPKFRDDSKDINGFIGPTLRQVQSISGKKGWKFEASAESLRWASEMQLGKTTITGSADPYSSTVKWRDVCTIDPPSFSYVHGLNCLGSTGTIYRRKGTVISQQTIEVKGKGPIMQSLNLEDDGSMVADSGFAFPAAATSVATLLGSMCQLQFGAVGSLVNLSTSLRLRSWKATINSQIKNIEVPNSSTFVDEYQYGEEAPTLDVDFAIKGDESSPEFGLFKVDSGAPTLCQMIMTIDNGGAPDRLWQLTMTNCHILACVPKPAGNEVQLNIKLGVLNTTTDAGPGQILCKTGLATSMVSA
jgi:hypothetical protein